MTPQTFNDECMYDCIVHALVARAGNPAPTWYYMYIQYKVGH